MPGFRKLGDPFRSFAQLGSPSGAAAALTFADQVLALFSGDFVAYYKMDETGGIVAVDSSPQGNDGQYTGVDLANTALPAAVGGSAPYFDGANDYLDAYSAGLVSDFNGAAGTAIGLCKVSPGAWTDATARLIATLRADNQNKVLIYKNSTSNQLIASYEANNIAKTITKSSVSPAGWFMFGLTWDKAADEVKAYYNGSQEGSTLNSLGVWAGSLSSTSSVFGSSNTTPTVVWDGWLGHMIVLSRAATPTEISTLYGYTGL